MVTVSAVLEQFSGGWLFVCALRCVPKTRAQCVCIVWHVGTIVNIYHV